MYTVVLMAAMSAGPSSTGQGYIHACTGCRGCYGCWGGFSGSGYNYMVGHGYQSAFSVYAPTASGGAFGCAGCYGCYGGWSCYGVPLPGHGTWTEGTTASPQSGNPKIEQTPPPKEQKLEKKSDDQARARLTIDAPDDAKVYLDGQLLPSPVAKRVFLTPELAPGHTYYYDLRVEAVRGGKTVTENQRIMLRQGQIAITRFPNLSQPAAVVPVATEHP